MKKIFSFIATTCILAVLVTNTAFADSQVQVQAQSQAQSQTQAQTQSIGVTYQGHVQNIGWQNTWASNGEEAGTDGKSLRLEAIKISLTNAPFGAKIKYQVHVQNIGWINSWLADGQEAGTIGKGLRLEAIKISLDGLPGYSVQYQTHVQNIGWMNWVCDGQTSGTEGRSLRVEAIRIRIVPTVHPTALTLNKNSVSLAVNETQQLSASISPENTTNQAINWASSDAKIATVNNDGKITGVSAGNTVITASTADGNITASCNVSVNTVEVTGISLNKSSDKICEGFSDTLTATFSPQNATNKNISWTSSNSNIANVDSSGRVTGIAIGDATITATTADGNKTSVCNVSIVNPSISYETHVQNIGWKAPVSDGQLSGTVGQSLRVEALKINLNNAPSNVKIKYQTYVQNYGWLSSEENGAVAGTIGQSLRVEALKISLENMPGYSVEYRTHVENIGWQPWVMNGNVAGTEGRSLRIEAIQVKLVKSVDVQYQLNIQNNGWQPAVSSGQIAATNGQPLMVQSFNVKLVDAPVGASIKYSAHVQNIGWQDWVTDGQAAGTNSQGLRIEAIKLQLINLPNYNVQYQVFVQNSGWTSWVQDGQVAGTTGQGLRIEGMRVRIISGADVDPVANVNQTATASKLASYLDSNENIASVNARAIQLHYGVTVNNCVFFSSEALRRIGFNVPLWMCNTKSYVPYLLNAGWKSNYNIDGLAPGDICFSVADSTGNPSHTYVFMGWVNPDDHTLAYVADNQDCDSIHIRSMIDAPGIDAFHFFVSY